jgi:hypothetical protein
MTRDGNHAISTADSVSLKDVGTVYGQQCKDLAPLLRTIVVVSNFFMKVM